MPPWNCCKVGCDTRFPGWAHWHCGQWEILFGLSSGLLTEVACMSIPGNTWTDALRAARFSCLCLTLYRLGVGWSLDPLVLFP